MVFLEALEEVLNSKERELWKNIILKILSLFFEKIYLKRNLFLLFFDFNEEFNPFKLIRFLFCNF